MNAPEQSAAAARTLDHEIIIIGSGFSGLGAAIKLKQQGFDDFVIVEKANGVGGTWRDNTYPGLCVDLTTLAYSYAFEPNPDWSRLYAPGAELKAYADHCSEKYGIHSKIRFGHGVTRSVYDAQQNHWVTHLDNGETLVSRYLVSACGVLSVPKMPEIEGIETFTGKVIHTARWDHQHNLEGERVAVIGTGASAIQVIPTIADRVCQLDVYQRTPIWLLPKFDFAISERTRKWFRRVPLLQKTGRLIINGLTELFWQGMIHYKQFPWMLRWVERQGAEMIRKQVDDPETAEKLIPSYNFFCKRPGFSSNYFPVYNRDNVALVTDPIERFTATGIVTRDGIEREVDTLICATGFSVFEKGGMPTFEVYGKQGMELGAFWAQNRHQAYEGSSVPNFPNFFLMVGPYAAGNPNWFGIIDVQTRHLVRCLKGARRKQANYIEIKRAAHDKNLARMLKNSKNTLLLHGNCTGSNSYYFDKHGDIPFIRPVSSLGMWLKSHTFSLNNYRYDTK
ncbi:MAG: NAD(P)/FAD-dependent oxidoreductase [Gammaproteobacteria bacterium]|nr:NAD(P)/FAD-dependent oxidoreductase [Gammaproteobacteria bacterium]